MAFLHGDLQPQFKLYARPMPNTPGVLHGQLLKLHKTVYGLKQASFEWARKLNGTLRECGYTQGVAADDCLWWKVSKSGRLMMQATYVDDILRAYAREDEAEMEADMKQMGKAFTLKDLGDAELLLGWRIRRGDNWLSVDQEGYVRQVLEQYGMDQCRPVDTPGTKLELLQEGSEEERADAKGAVEHSHMTLANYSSVVGALQYLASSTRPDIATAVNTLGSFNADPRPCHLRALKRIMRYLAGTAALGITYTRTEDGVFRLCVYSDSDWAGDPSDRRSITGYVMQLCGGAISWYSKKQSTVSLSSTEAEYNAGAETAREVTWLRALLTDMGEEQKHPTIVQIDNQGAIAMGNGSGSVDRRKHIDVKHHYLKEKVEMGILELVYVPSASNLADIFTKPLDKIKFIPLRDAVMGSKGVGSTADNNKK